VRGTRLDPRESGRSLFIIDTGRRAFLTIGQAVRSARFDGVRRSVVMYSDGVVEYRDENMHDNIAALGEFVRRRLRPTLHQHRDRHRQPVRSKSDRRRRSPRSPALHIHQERDDPSVHTPLSVSWTTTNTYAAAPD
jgi:hypothetical protein